MADASVIKEFLVALGFKIDDSGFTRFNDTLKKTSSGAIVLTKTLGEIGAAATAMAVAVTAATLAVADRLSQLYYTSQRTGTTANNLKALGFAVGQIGLSADSVVGQLAGFRRALIEAPPLKNYFQNMFGSAEPQKVLEGLAGAMRRAMDSNNQYQQVVILGMAKTAGYSADTIIQIARNFDAYIGARKEAADFYRRIHVDYDEETGRSVQATRAYGTAVMQLSGVFDKFVSTLFPGFTVGLNTISSWIDEHDKDIKKIGDDFRAWASDPENIKAFVDALKSFGSVLSFVVNDVKQFAGEVAGLIREITGLYKSYQEWAAGVEQRKASKGHPNFWGDPFSWGDEGGRGVTAPIPPRSHYALGGVVPINAHAGEMVLPRSISEGLQGFFGGSGGGFLHNFGSWISGSAAYKPFVRIEGVDQIVKDIISGMMGGAGAPGGGGGVFGGFGNRGMAPAGSAGGGGGNITSKLSYGQIKQFALAAGFKGKAADIITALSMAESSGDPGAISKTGDYGITQINRRAHGDVALEALNNPKRAMELAFGISKGGENFSPWTTYKSGAYLSHLTAARGAKPEGLGGGSMDAMAPAGARPINQGVTTIRSLSGRAFQVASQFADNFKGFIDDYERSGGVIGPNSGGLSGRPGNASYHPIGRAIDINQIARDVRAGGKTLPTDVENALAQKWGLYPGSLFRHPDAGHFEARNADAALSALGRTRLGTGGITNNNAQRHITVNQTNHTTIQGGDTEKIHQTHRRAASNLFRAAHRNLT